MSRVIGRRVPMEYTPKTGNFFPPYGQMARGAAPSFAIGSGCVGAFDTTSLVFSAASLPSGLITLTAKGYLPNVTRLNTASYDVGQAHFSTHAFTSPNGVLVGHPSLSLESPSATIATGDALPASATLTGLYVSGSTVVYAPNAIATPVSFTIPVTVLFLGDVTQ